MIAFTKGWTNGRPETNCGGGSTLASTAAARAALVKWIDKYQIKSLNDAGAGDLNWIRKVGFDIEYRPYDLVKWDDRIIEWDISKDPLPRADATLCRHVLNHLGPGAVAITLELLKRSCTYLIANTGGPKKEVAAIGHFCDYDLEKPPFDLGEPLESVDDCKRKLAIWNTERFTEDIKCH